MPEVHIIAEVQINPQYSKEMAQAMQELVAQSRAEPGNISYELLQDPADPNHLFFVETWASEDAVATHNNSPHFLKYHDFAAGKMDPPRVIRLKNIS